MPDFIGDIHQAFLQVVQAGHEFWDATPIASRLLACLLLAGLGVYLGSRSERGGISAMFFFAAFGFFAYVMAVGIHLIH
jgi:hypothetical protein